MAQKAKIRIVTKSLDRQPGATGKKGQEVKKELADLVQLMRRSGIAIDLRRETHEKIIVINERIVWNGSLNMLSQVKDSTREHMTRTDDQNYAKEILNLLSRHDMCAGKIIDSEHPVCPVCNAKTYLSTGLNGVIKLRCEDECGWSVKQDYFKKLIQGIPLGKTIKPCPQPACEGSLQLRYAYSGYFLGCTNYGSGCKHKEDVHVSKYIYTPFPSEQQSDVSLLSSYSWPSWEILSERVGSVHASEEKELFDAPKIATQKHPSQGLPQRPLKTSAKKEPKVREEMFPPTPPAPKQTRINRRDKTEKRDLDFINCSSRDLIGHLPGLTGRGCQIRFNCSIK
jgi:hypothetical protein